MIHNDGSTFDCNLIPQSKLFSPEFITPLSFQNSSVLDSSRLEIPTSHIRKIAHRVRIENVRPVAVETTRNDQSTWDKKRKKVTATAVVAIPSAVVGWTPELSQEIVTSVGTVKNRGGGVESVIDRPNKKRNAVVYSNESSLSETSITRGVIFGIENLCLQIHPANALRRAEINTLWEHTAPFANDSDDTLLESIAGAVSQISLRLTPEKPLTEDEVYQLWEDATAAEKSLLTLERAIEVAEGFRFPRDIAISDMQKFESVDWDFAALARLRISELPSDRINEEAIHAHIARQTPTLTTS
jgi:hypothetical protein